MRRLMLSLLVMAVLITTTYAITIHVPEQFATIAEAIEIAVDGDSILVGPGIYDPPPTVYNEPDSITLLGNVTWVPTAPSF